jgi:hypothetical protein
MDGGRGIGFRLGVQVTPSKAAEVLKDRPRTGQWKVADYSDKSQVGKNWEIADFGECAQHGKKVWVTTDGVAASLPSAAFRSEGANG